MKVKTLRFKDTKEFVHILEGGELATSGIPDVLAHTASIKALEDYYENYLGKKIKTENLEVVEYDFIDGDEVGADIRNKLSPPSNLVALLNQYFEDNDVDKDTLKTFILREMKNTSKSIDYLTKLF